MIHLLQHYLLQTQQALILETKSINGYYNITDIHKPSVKNRASDKAKEESFSNICLPRVEQIQGQDFNAMPVTCQSKRHSCRITNCCQSHFFVEFPPPLQKVFLCNSSSEKLCLKKIEDYFSHLFRDKKGTLLLSA